MEIGEFRKQFMEQLRFDAEHEGSAPEAQFISRALELLEDIGDVSDPMPMSIEMKGRRGRIMSFDAYAYDEADGALVMIASDFVNEIDNIPTLTNTRIDELFLHMRNFIEESVDGDISAYCDDSDQAINVAKEIKTKVGLLLKSPDSSLSFYPMPFSANRLKTSAARNSSKGRLN